MITLALQRFWDVWKRFGLFMGNLIGRIILTIFYFTIFLPFGLGMRLFGDPLAIKKEDDFSWLDRETKDRTLKDTRRLV
jgi:hypothetical protein